MPRTKPKRTMSVATTASIAMSIGRDAVVVVGDVREEVAALRDCNAECSCAE